MKSRLTISRLRAHLRTLVETSPFARALKKKTEAEGREYKWEDMVRKVHILAVQVDLCDLKSVYALADQLVNGTIGSPDATNSRGGRLPYGSLGTQSYSEDIQQHPDALRGANGAQRAWGWGLSGIRLPRLDVIALNAGIGGWVGVNWRTTIMDVLYDVIDATTWPQFKLADYGAVVKAQLPSKTQDSGDGKQRDPPLGQVFCSNVFGHYILTHELMPLLSQPASTGAQTSGKIIWISSIEAQQHSFNIDDIQGLQSLIPYESSKRLTDLIALTAELPSVARISAPYFDASQTITTKEAPNGPLVKPTMYTTHPGVFNSDILPLPSILMFFWRIVALLSRWLGSPWHVGDPYKAAVAPVWVALTTPERLEDFGGSGVKWGSATNSWGNERVKMTEVGGWGWNGNVGVEINAEKRSGRHKKAVDLTEEAREEFEVLGSQSWKQMEVLRTEWEGLLKPIIQKK
jgi:3-keto steroid reductase